MFVLVHTNMCVACANYLDFSGQQWRLLLFQRSATSHHLGSAWVARLAFTGYPRISFLSIPVQPHHS